MLHRIMILLLSYVQLLLMLSLVYLIFHRILVQAQTYATSGLSLVDTEGAGTDAALLHGWSIVRRWSIPATLDGYR